MSLNDEPVILIEDDPNDIDVLSAAFTELEIPHPLMVFYTAQEAIDYLLSTSQQPFLILCDIRMPAINGLSLRKMINENELLKMKSIPFVFLTGIVSQHIVYEAYLMGIQGFYQKADSYPELKKQLFVIYTYFKGCLHPNSVK